MSANTYLNKGLRIFLPASVFLAVLVIHFLWTGNSPYEETQVQWVEIDNNITWWQKYINSQDYYLGFSYAISFAFTAIAFRNYRERSFCDSSKFAFGGLSFSGGLAVAGCFLVGCCGSPMLVVYSSLFGMKYASMAKPFIAGFTALIIGLSWFWMNKKLAPMPVSTDSCSPNKTDGPCC